MAALRRLSEDAVVVSRIGSPRLGLRCHDRLVGLIHEVAQVASYGRPISAPTRVKQFKARGARNLPSIDYGRNTAWL